MHWHWAQKRCLLSAERGKAGTGGKGAQPSLRSPQEDCNHSSFLVTHCNGGFGSQVICTCFGLFLQHNFILGLFMITKWNFFCVFHCFLSPTQVRFLLNREMASGRRGMRKSLENPIDGVDLVTLWLLEPFKAPTHPALTATPEKCLCFHSSREEYLS